MADKINFTVTTLQAVQCPEGADRIYVYDSKIPRLAFCKTASGSTSFYLYYRAGDGRPKRYLIGGYPDISIDAARKEAAKLNGEIAKGNDPQATRLTARAETTFGELFKKYMEGHAKAHKRTWADDQQMYDLHLVCWKNRKASSINRHEVRALHVKIGESAKYAANRVLALVSKVFSFGIELGIKENPAKGVERFAEIQRKRFLGADELPRFFSALKAEPDEMMRDYFSILLLTGARRSNAAAMRWDNLNLDAGVWTVPGEESKSGEVLLIHLSDPALEILFKRRDDQQKKHAAKIAASEIAADAPSQEWVFPSFGRTGHLTEPKAAWAALLTRAGIVNLRLHDLRRTLGSWQAGLGASLNIIGASLGHRNIATTQIYARLNLSPVAASVNAATVAILEASKAKPVKAQQLPAA